MRAALLTMAMAMTALPVSAQPVTLKVYQATDPNYAYLSWSGASTTSPTTYSGSDASGTFFSQAFQYASTPTTSSLGLAVKFRACGVPTSWVAKDTAGTIVSNVVTMTFSNCMPTPTPSPTPAPFTISVSASTYPNKAWLWWYNPLGAVTFTGADASGTFFSLTSSSPFSGSASSPNMLVPYRTCGVPTTWAGRDSTGKALSNVVTITFPCVGVPSPTPTLTPTPALTAPTNVTAVGVNVDAVDVSWTQPPYTTSCKMGYGLSSGSVAGWQNQAGTGYGTVIGLARATTYYFVVVCSGPYGASPMSAPVAAKTTSLLQ